ncbi:MAG: class I SAM-dependent rRNA methyltransferase [Bacillota bacterium]|nr:class I SAM-dependent rRNA methyltransferase [Bacillota bacterium]
MIEIIARKQYDEKFKEGFPLLVPQFVFETDLSKVEGELFHLLDHKNHFIAKGYVGKQNKGLGWLLSWKENEEINDQFFMSKFIVALNKRTKFFQDEETTAFRVFNGEGDGIGGLTIDYYGGYYLFTFYSQGIYKFKDSIINQFKNLVAFDGIYEKRRFDEKGKYMDADDFVMGQRGDFPIIIKENGVNISVNLNDGAMTGVFLDQRDVRKTIMRKYANGKSVLNTFSYTGVFSVFAIMGGAKFTESVDLANRSYAKTSEQMEINVIDYETQSIVIEDVFKYFKRAKSEEKTFDMVILDPPSYAKSKGFTFSSAKDYTGLIKDAIDLTNDDGMIVASTNNSSVTREKFKSMIDDAFKAKKTKYKIVEEFGLPKDFAVNDRLKESDYLKVFFIKKS